MEALQVPVAAAIRWLRGEKPPSISDVANLEPEEPEDSLERSRPALVWNEHALEYVDVAQRRSQLRPNSTLIVPSEYGGLHALNWDPSSTEPVSDLGDRAQREQRHDVVLRLHAAVMASALPSETLSRPPRQPHADDTESDEHELVAAYLEQLPNPKEEWLAKNIEALLGEYRGAGRLSEGDRVQNRKAPRLIAVSPLPSEAAQGELAPMLIVRARRPSFDMGAEADQSSLTGVEVPLASHVNGVASHAREFALAVGLPAELVEVLERAGLWHDAGKADPRFQQWLHGGSAFRALKAEQLLAKSAMPHQDRARRELARQRAGYPKGARHELLSLALLNSLQQPLGPVHHWDLVKHLIASHHGHCRPFAPFVADSEPVDVGYEVETQRVRASSATGVEQLDSGVSDRFWGLVERYGWYGLSWLEAILRLADHRQSEAEQKTGHDSEEQSHAA
jgi:CRISPR-associated endonuclease/helicase Cas3